MENITEFLITEKNRVSKLYSKNRQTGFSSKEEFSAWYIEKIKEQKFECYYCTTSIFDIKKLIKEGKLLTRKAGKGVRGPILEIDKKNNPLGYNKENCVLSCYYCNNDKSYTLDSETYKKFFGEGRRKFFEYLLNT
ncbi:MAG: hypothetical protein JWN78_690 [Bacteroidota bacterium]|nr:hypothetical protein [Bacteroidota bacterium]